MLVNTAYASEFEGTLELAKKGDVIAQYHLGLMYDLVENDAEAVKWYRKAADQGLADAQYHLGVMYANGLGVPENDAEAVKWHRKAADQGDASAQYNLGFMYANGHGVPANFIRGYLWWSMAKTQGEESAAKDINTLIAVMTPNQIADGQALAAKCFESNYKECD